MVSNEWLERLKVVLQDFTKAARLAELTTRLMEAFLVQVEKEEKKRIEEVGKIKLNLFPAICFAILMENGQGIISKSPGYVLEKLRACFGGSSPEMILDFGNLSKLQEWKAHWNKGGE